VTPAAAAANVWDQRVGDTTPPMPAAAAAAAPAVEQASFIDTGRFDGADAAAAPAEDVPGLIDSRLYGAFTPEQVHAPPMEGLLTHHVETPDVPALGAQSAGAGLMMTGYQDVGDVQTEAPPGFIDSTLYGQYTPDHVQTAELPGVERTSTTLMSTTARAVADDDGPRTCVSCSTPIRTSTCPECGARQPEDDA